MKLSGHLIPPILIALVLPVHLQAQTSHMETEKATTQLVLDVPPKVTGVQVRVIDGDTIVVSITRHRLWGVDAPEKTQSCFRDGAIYPCGHDAARRLRDLIGTAHVYCEPRATDPDGASVAVCGTCPLPFSDRVMREPPAASCVQDLGAAMVRDGWAVASEPGLQNYGDLEAEARVSHRGLWAGTFQMPWEWRAERRRQ
jgi:endonuclease YncB( thermonuclease family)